MQHLIDEFLAGIEDPKGRVYKAAYRSFTQGQIEMHAYAMRMGLEHNVDPRIFVEARMMQHVKQMLGAA